jgi:hypothetical protein
MEDEHREVYSLTLQVFQNKLEVAVSLLKGLLKLQHENEEGMALTTYKVSRWKSASKSKAWTKLSRSLKLRQGIADQSWFLLLKIADTQVDQALAARSRNDDPSIGKRLPSIGTIRASSGHMNAVGPKKIRFSSNALKGMAVNLVSYCDSLAVAMETHSDGTVGKYTLNNFEGEPDLKRHLLKRNVRDLARRLQVDEPHNFRLLGSKELRRSCPDYVWNGSVNLDTW